MRLFRSGGEKSGRTDGGRLPFDPEIPGTISVTDTVTLEQLVQQIASLPSPWTLEMPHNRILSGEGATIRAAFAGDIFGWKALERIFWSPPLGEALWIPASPPPDPQFTLSSAQLPSFLKRMRRFREWMKSHGLTPGTVLRFSSDVDPVLFLDWPVVEGFLHMMQRLNRWEWTLEEVLDLFREKDTEILGQWLVQWERLDFLTSPRGLTPFFGTEADNRRKHA